MDKSKPVHGLSFQAVEKICRVFSKYEDIDEVVLYGSRAKGNFKSGSDIDFTLKGGEINLQLLNKISLDLDDFLGTLMLCKRTKKVGKHAGF